MRPILHSWSSWIKILLFSLHGLECFEHGHKQILGLFNIWDTQWMIGQWGNALRKSFKMMVVFVGFWRREKLSLSSPWKSEVNSSVAWIFSEYWIAAITADEWASSLYSFNCLAKDVFLCAKPVEDNQDIVVGSLVPQNVDPPITVQH